jgi:hypothetical protein
MSSFCGNCNEACFHNDRGFPEELFNHWLPTKDNSALRQLSVYLIGILTSQSVDVLMPFTSLVQQQILCGVEGEGQTVVNFI